MQAGRKPAERSGASLRIVLASVCASASAVGCGRCDFLSEPPDAAVDARIDARLAPPLCASNPAYTVRGTLVNRYRELSVRTWFEAVDACAVDEAYLAIPDDFAEVVMIENPGEGTWIGITDLEVEGVWRTVTGALATYLPWGPVEPNGDSAENCVELFESTFNDLACNTLHLVMCECEVVGE